jgi:hypothetical protein
MASYNPLTTSFQTLLPQSKKFDSNLLLGNKIQNSANRDGYCTKRSDGIGSAVGWIGLRLRLNV